MTIQKLNVTQKNQTTQNTAKQNYTGSVASYDTRPGNIIVQCSRANTGAMLLWIMCYSEYCCCV